MDKHFTKHLLVLVTTLLLGTSLSSSAEDIQRISVDSSGVEGNGESYMRSPSISSDGLLIVFQSDANNLVAGDTNSQSDIFVHNRHTGVTSRVSLHTDSTQGNGHSTGAALSTDGRFVAFSSYASNLVANDTNGAADVFVHDLNTSVTTRVSLHTDGTQGNNASNSAPSLSADGRYVAFSSSATNLVAGDTNNKEDVFAHDRSTGVTSRISLHTDGTQGNYDSNGPSLSVDGRYVAFSSSASNLTSGLHSGPGQSQVFIHDRNTGVTTFIGNGLGHFNSASSWSADGRFVAISSIDAGISSSSIFIHDRDTGINTLVSRSTDGTQGNNFSLNPSLSANGRYVAFGSSANNLAAGDTNSAADVFVHDRNTGKTIRTNHAFDGAESDGNTYATRTALSADGRFIAFASNATNLITNDNNASIDVFVTFNPLTRTRNDFNGDGKADILWRNTTTGLNYLYQMDGASITSHTPINAVSDQNWQIQGVADFDGDGKADILWRNVTTGVNYLYLMNGDAVTSHGLINVVPDQNWQIQGVADFDGDGKADILWRNITTGLNYIYFMNGAEVASHGLINVVSDQYWQIKGTDDFDGDGKADILWRNMARGTNAIYLMNGKAIISSKEINSLTDRDWQVKGTGDFDGDGKADILWRHAASGQNWIYLMDGVSITAHGGINIVSDADWQIKGVADFNGDSKADILWRHATSGLNYLYFMNGSSITSHGAINSVPDSDWQIQ